MTAITFDSLSSVKRLREKGIFSQEQAELIADELRTTKEVDVSHLATKDELHTFKSELKDDIKTLDRKIDVSVAELHKKIDVSVAELKTNMAQLEAGVLKHMLTGFIALGGFLTAVIGLAVGLLVKLH